MLPSFPPIQIEEVESRTQRSRPRPRTQNKSKAKDRLSEDRHSQGQRQECSRPRPRTNDTAASVHRKKKVFIIFSGDPKKRKVFKNFFQVISTKKGLEKNFSADVQNFNHSKNSAVLDPRTGQFWRT